MQGERVTITLNHEQLMTLDRIEILGSNRAEKVKNALISWMSEKGYLKVRNNH